jgi:hypothetical protein
MAYKSAGFESFALTCEIREAQQSQNHTQHFVKYSIDFSQKKNSIDDKIKLPPVTTQNDFFRKSTNSG